jgi:alkanesulfonate monooxygenase SsuD/methylene tetrahydromethanopterin reductase-like flavin-dependent oxidoreductase (luciferase family)
MSWKYEDMGEAYGSLERRRPPALTAEQEGRRAGTAIVGTPEHVAEEIAAYRDVLGPDGHSSRARTSRVSIRGIQRETLRLFGEEVRGLLA